MPGWDAHSYGYHGDDGGIFHNSGNMQRPFGPRYGAGDTVGCGLDYSNGGIFFTLNGELLGYGWTGEAVVIDPVVELFPTVGVDTDCPLACNFGERLFVFDLGRFAGQYRNVVEQGLGGLRCRRRKKEEATILVSNVYAY